MVGARVPRQVAEQRIQPGQDLGIGRAVSTGRGDRHLEELGEARAVEDDPWLTVSVLDDEGSEVEVGELGEQGRRVTERVHRGGRVVDPGGQRLVDDVGDLAQAVADVLGCGPLRTEADRGEDPVDEPVEGLAVEPTALAGPDVAEGRALHHERTRAPVDAEDDVDIDRGGDQLVSVQTREEPGGPRPQHLS